MVWWNTVSKTGHLKGRRQWWLIAEKETERRCIPKVKLKTSLSDPQTPLIAHSLKERDSTEEEAGKREWKIKRGRARMREVKGPCRHLKSQQAQTYPSPKNHREQSHTLSKWPLTNLNTCSKMQVGVGVGVCLCATNRGSASSFHKSPPYQTHMFLPLRCLSAYYCAIAVRIVSADLFHKCRVYAPECRLNVSVYC